MLHLAIRTKPFLPKIASLFLLFMVSGCRGQSQAELLSTARAHHRAAREAINTLRADVTREMTVPEAKVLGKGTYWRSLNTVRVHEPADASWVTDTLVKDGEVRQIGYSPINRNRPYSAGRKPASGVICFCDVWQLMLFEFPGPAGSRVDLEGFLDSAREAPSARSETVDGHKCVRLSMTCETPQDSEWTNEFWLDIECNYLVRKRIATFSKGSEPVVYEVTDFKEVSPGVFVPIRSRIRGHKGGKLTGEVESEETTTLSNVHVNEEIPKSVFTLPAVPPGTKCKDLIDGTEYVIDGNWTRSGVAIPFAPVTLPPTSSAQPAIEYQAQSESESGSWTRWVLPGSLFVLLSAAGLWWYRRTAAARDTGNV